MKVELFYTPGCGKCATAREELKALASQTVPDLEWRDINVQDVLDYAVELGVLTLPALAIDGRLEFSSMPTAAQWTQALRRFSMECQNGH